MSGVRIKELPPSNGKTGWPWTEAEQIQERDGRAELVTVVTPSYNQAQFLEETIRSVILQGYPSVEYMIFDGGSTDGSLEIIKGYNKWLAYWESAPDEGQSDAISKGWRRASGSILAFLNSDDLYMPGAIAQAVSAFKKHPDAVAICGGEILINSDGFLLLERSVKSASLRELLNLQFLPQPSVFISRSALERVGYPDSALKNSFDFELWIRLAQVGKIACIPDVLAATRIHSGAKTMSRRKEIKEEIEKIIEGVLKSPAGRALPGKDRRQIGQPAFLSFRDSIGPSHQHRIWSSLQFNRSVCLQALHSPKDNETDCFQDERKGQEQSLWSERIRHARKQMEAWERS